MSTSQLGGSGETCPESGNFCETHCPVHSEPGERDRAGGLQKMTSGTPLFDLLCVTTSAPTGVNRCLRTLAFTACISMFMYFSVSLVIYYSEFHHVTKLEERSSSERVFPAVTFCNINPVRKSAVTSCDVEQVGQVFSLRANNTENLSDPCGKFDWVKFYDHASHKLWDMVKYCRFREEHCTAEDFESVSNFLPSLFELNYFRRGFGPRLACCVWKMSLK